MKNLTPFNHYLLSLEVCPTLRSFKMPKADSPVPEPLAMAEVGMAVKSVQKTSESVNAALTSAKERFVKSNPNSKKIFESACDYLPGGNTRTLLYTAPYPLCMARGEAHQVYDEDGHV